MSNDTGNLKKQHALQYHAEGRAGKIEVTPTKPCLTQADLSLAYSPGVASPCMEIHKNPDDVYKYTAKGNLVAVISNGTAVLGLGDIGPEAGKPVMEGKGVLFKRFADIDVFDIEVDETSVDGFVNVVKALEPTFGGVNLEDIKAPECFEIEKKLIELMDIPVFHDDQHGTAIISSAAFLNALEITGRDISKVKVVFSGAGAASISCAKLFMSFGVRPENLFMCDSKGVIYKGRTEGMNKYKEEFANDTKHRTLADAIQDADAFMGLSAKGVLTKEMVKTMASNPIIFAMANPDPEILPEEVAQVRDDAIMATGRSDYPNQVNNVLGFPFIFRGALDVRARKINEEMKKAAVTALANLAKEEVPEEVKRAYNNEDFSFGRNYLIPKPFDKRVLTRVCPAVAKAAIDTGVARIPIDDFQSYVLELEARLGTGGAFMNSLRSRLPKQKMRVIYPEGSNTRILNAVSNLIEDDIIDPILIGDMKEIHEKMDSLNLSHLKTLPIVNPEEDERLDIFTDEYFKQKQRKGVSNYYAQELMTQPNYFGSMMVKHGHADGMVTGVTQSYPETVKPIFSVAGTHKSRKGAGIIILVYKNRTLFLADCTVQFDPSSKELADIALSTANFYRHTMQREPRLAFLSYSNFGSAKHPTAKKVQQAVELTKKADPKLIVDGEIQADVAINDGLRQKLFDFSTLDREADVLIFPDLNSSNIAYKLLNQLSETTALGPILVPLKEPINIVQRTSTVNEIVNMSIITALHAHELQRQKGNEENDNHI